MPNPLLSLVNARSRVRAGVVAAAFSLPALLLGGGCAPTATFPPTPGTGTFEPWVAPVPEIMALGVTVTRERMAPSAPPVFNLPPGVPQWTWEEVGRRIGNGAIAMVPADRQAFSVEQVRLSGARAEVDVIYPAGPADGGGAGAELFQMVTIGMTTDPFQPWRPTFVRKWRLPISPPTSNWGMWTIQEDTDYPNLNPPPWKAEAQMVAPVEPATMVETGGSPDTQPLPDR